MKTSKQILIVLAILILASCSKDPTSSISTPSVELSATITSLSSEQRTEFDSSLVYLNTVKLSLYNKGMLTGTDGKIRLFLQFEDGSNETIIFGDKYTIVVANWAWRSTLSTTITGCGGEGLGCLYSKNISKISSAKVVSLDYSSGSGCEK